MYKVLALSFRSEFPGDRVPFPWMRAPRLRRETPTMQEHTDYSQVLVGTGDRFPIAGTDGQLSIHLSSCTRLSGFFKKARGVFFRDSTTVTRAILRSWDSWSTRAHCRPSERWSCKWISSTTVRSLCRPSAPWRIPEEFVLRRTESSLEPERRNRLRN